MLADIDIHESFALVEAATEVQSHCDAPPTRAGAAKIAACRPHGKPKIAGRLTLAADAVILEKCSYNVLVDTVFI